MIHRISANYIVQNSQQIHNEHAEHIGTEYYSSIIMHALTYTYFIFFRDSSAFATYSRNVF
jgi:hypothetical protein